MTRIRPWLLIVPLALAPPAVGFFGAWGTVLAQTATGTATATATATGELTLPATVERLALSPQARAADLALDSARRALDSARASAGLGLSAGGTVNYSNATTTSSTGETTTAGARATVSTTLSLNVLPWSPAYDTIRAAERQYLRATYTRDDSRSSLTQTVYSQYFAARLAGFDLEVARASRALAERRLAVATAQQAAGAASADAVLAARQSAEAARVAETQAQTTLELNRLTLFNSLGLPASDAVLSTAPAEAVLPGTLEALIGQALSRRSEVLAALTEVQDAEDNLNVARRDRLLPSANLQVSYGASGGPSVTAGLDLRGGAASLTGSYPVVGGNAAAQAALSAQASLSIPVLSPSGSAQIAAAEATLASEQLALESVRQTVALDVRSKYAAAQNALLGVASARAARATAASALETARARLAAGLATALDVEGAQLDLLRADRDLEAALENAQLAVVALQDATGTLTPQGGSQ